MCALSHIFLAVLKVQKRSAWTPQPQPCPASFLPLSTAGSKVPIRRTREESLSTY